MRLVFAGTPDFAAAALHALLAAGHDIPLVLTQPDRPAGRGMKLQASPVKQLALERGIALSQPRSLRLDGKYPDDALQARDALRAVEPAAIVVAAYGLLLPRWVLDSTVGEPSLGCLNIHASLLPRWRGAAPIQRAIEAGDARTGVTIMRMDEGLDTGGMLSVESLEIGADETTATLHDRLAVLGARLMVETIERASRAPLEARAQPTEGVTYASKIEKREAAIDWTHPATELERRIRAFDPFPGATFAWRGEVLKCWAAEAVVTEAAEPPGTVIGMDDGRPLVRCGEGALRLTLLQRPGGKRLPAQEALRGRALQAGEALLMAG